MTINLPDVSCKYGAPMGRGWDFQHQPEAAHSVVRMYATDPPTSDVERRHLTVARAFLRAVDPSLVVKVSLRRIRLDSGGYDSGGAYWGIGAPLYWAASEDGAVDMWFRARDRDSAKAIVREKHPGAVFYN